jgi:CDP-diacylglycerol--glycerol-3-phosphate 3-phosphatidyltransferase
MVMIIMLLADINVPAWSVAATVVTYIALILTVVSLIDYIVKNKGVMQDEG